MEKQKILFFIFFLIISKTKAVEPVTKKITVPDEQKEITVYFYNDNKHEIKNFQDQNAHSGSSSSSQSSSSSSSKSSSQSSASAQVQATIQTHIQMFLTTVQEQFSKQNIQMIKEKAQKQASNARVFAIAYLQEHKFEIPLILLASCYGFILYKLLYYSYQTVRSDTWACWKDNVPLDMLRIIPEQELGKELVFAAQEKYQKPDMLNDLLTPLIFFLRDIDYELHHLQRFIYLYKWLKKLHLTYFFPSQEKVLHKAEEKYARLQYLKNVFIRWVTDYKLAIETKKNNVAG